MSTATARRQRRKQLFRQLNEASDQDERDKIATQIIRLTSKPGGRRKPQGRKRGAVIGADPKQVQKQRRAVALANETEESEMKELTFDIRTLETGTLEALKNDPAVNEEGVDIIAKEIESRSGDEEGEAIAASHGGRIQSFEDFCAESYAEEKRSASR